MWIFIYIYHILCHIFISHHTRVRQLLGTLLTWTLSNGTLLNVSATTVRNFIDSIKFLCTVAWVSPEARPRRYLYSRHGPGPTRRRGARSATDHAVSGRAVIAVTRNNRHGRRDRCDPDGALVSRGTRWASLGYRSHRVRKRRHRRCKDRQRVTARSCRSAVPSRRSYGNRSRRDLTI